MTVELMSIWVTGSFVAFHRYPTAPNDVKYLGHTHRHKFFWRAEIFINPAIDRELEFHQVQSLISAHLPDNVNKCDAGSCEQMAKLISRIIRDHVTINDHIVTVSEDNECGSTYYRIVSRGSLFT